MLKPQHFVISVFLILTAVLLSGPSLWAQEREWISFRERWAILIGVGAYPRDSGIPPLFYPAKDVESMKDILISLGGFKQENVISLVDSQVTYEGVDRAFEKIKDGLTRGEDLMLFYFSGRGTRMADTFSPDKEIDNLDECLLLYNANMKSEEGWFRDDKIGDWLQKLGPKKSIIIIDCSYCGERREEKGIRSHDDRDERQRIDRDGITLSDYSIPKDNTVIFEACNSEYNETAIDGLFTSAIKQCMDGRVAHYGIVTLDNLAEGVRDAMRRLRINQNPSISGSDMEKILLVAPFLEIKSEPSGAGIKVDGYGKGVTPGTVFLPIGKHSLEVRKAGYEVRRYKIDIPGFLTEDDRRSLIPPLIELDPAEEGEGWLRFVLTAIVPILLGLFGLISYLYSRRQLQEIIKLIPHVGEYDEDAERDFRVIQPELRIKGVKRFFQNMGIEFASPETKTTRQISELRDILAHKKAGDALEVIDDSESEAFEKHIKVISNVLCNRLGFERASSLDLKEVRVYGHRVKTKLRKLMSSQFQLVYLHSSDPSSDDIHHLKQLIDGRAGQFFSLLMLFKDHKIRQKIESELSERNFIVLDREATDGIIFADSPMKSLMDLIAQQAMTL